jgi:hypothetical protein
MDETEKMEALSKETGITVEWLQRWRNGYIFADMFGKLSMSFEDFAEAVRWSKEFTDITLQKDGEQNVID